jgi:hypothetical protein
MKNVFLLLVTIIPYIAFSQSNQSVNQLITIDGRVYAGEILSCKSRKVVFKYVTPGLKMNSIHVSEVSAIYGDLPVIRRNAISMGNPDIIFHPGLDTTYQSNTLPAIQPAANAKMVNGSQRFLHNFSAGDHLQMAGRRYLTGIALSFTGVGLVGVGIGTGENGLAYVGAGVSIVGSIISLTGHFELIKAGEKLNSDAITISPSEHGVGLAINF